MPKKDPCKACACNIQKCLKENNYQESACKDIIEEMRQCCIKWGDRSFVCSGFNTKTPSKQKSWIYRNPRLFVGIGTTVSLLVLFSRPIYDFFISSEPLPDIESLVRERQLEKAKEKALLERQQRQ